MSDLRPDLPHAPESGSVVRDAKIEELLLTGLDQYFAGHYEQAVNVWTRVLFLDRGHARARAYIERARSAIAERQRESEELLQRGIAAFERGDADAARRLLEASVERGGPSDLALTFLSRLHRREPGGAEAPRDAQAPAPNPAREAPGGAPKGAVRWGVALTIAAGTVIVVSAAIAVSNGSLRWAAITGDAPASGGTAMRPEPLRVPRAADDALARARTQYRRGHLNEALVELDQIRVADPLRPDADRLKAEIQRTLIEAAGAAVRRP